MRRWLQGQIQSYKCVGDIFYIGLSISEIHCTNGEAPDFLFGLLKKYPIKKGAKMFCSEKLPERQEGEIRYRQEFAALLLVVLYCFHWRVVLDKGQFQQ